MASDPTRIRILDAALKVINEAGACRLTIDAVAAASGVSKGGVLYHFHDKDSLLAGILNRYIDEEMAKYRDAEVVHGKTTKGRLHASISVNAQRANSPIALPLLGILALNPSLLKRPQELNQQYHDDLRKDRTTFTQAMIVILVNAGLNLGEALGTVKLSTSEREAIITELHRLVDRLPQPCRQESTAVTVNPFGPTLESEANDQTMMPT
jgi:AcrR family transcriptional regulator